MQGRWLQLEKEKRSNQKRILKIETLSFKEEQKEVLQNRRVVFRQRGI